MLNFHQAVLFIWLVLIYCPEGIAQPDFRNPGSGRPQLGGSGYVEENPDTANIIYFFSNRIDEQYQLSDTLLGNYLQQYDPIRYRLLDYAHLGNIGTAARPVVFQTERHLGFETGLNQYDLYYYGSDDLPYYKVYQALTDLYYSQGGEQDDGYFKVKFTQNFSKGIHLSLMHNRIYHLVRETSLRQNGSYLPQRTRHTQFGFGIWYNAPDKKYDSFISYTNNIAEQAENGGITPQGDLLLTTGNNGIDYTVETFLSGANTRHQHREFAYTHYYRLTGQKDSTGQAKTRLTLYHKVSYESSIYKFADNSTGSNADFYGPFLVDERGLRHFVEHRKWLNDFKIRLGHLDTEQHLPGKPLVEVGLHYGLHNLNQEPLDSIINNLYLTGKVHFNLGDRLNLRTYSHIGLLQHAGDFNLTGTLFIDFKTIGQIQLNLMNQRYTPTLLQKRIWVSQRQIWQNDFNKPFETSLSASYTLEGFKLNLSGAYHLLDNFIYFDTSSIPRQINGTISVIQLMAQKNIQFWKFYLENLIVFQKSTESAINLPTLYTKHSLYYESGLFRRAMLLRLGTDVRFNTPYFASGYQPLTGQFHIQREKETPLYPAVDLFLSFKVTRYSFRFFVKMENVASFFLDDYYFQIYRFPVPDRALRLGLSWRLLR